MFRPAFRRLLLILLLLTSATLLSAADFPVAKNRRGNDQAIAPDTQNENRTQSDKIPVQRKTESSATGNLPSIGKPAKQVKGGTRLQFKGMAVMEPEDTVNDETQADTVAVEPSDNSENETTAVESTDTDTDSAQETDIMDTPVNSQEKSDGPGRAIARRQQLPDPVSKDGETEPVEADSDDKEDEKPVTDKKTVVRSEKLPFEGWDEYHATLAIHQWLKQNATFADLAPTEQEELTDHFLNIIFSGEMNPSVVRSEIRAQRFKSTASVLTAPLAERLPDRLLFDYKAINYGGEPESHRITVPAPVGERNISIASPDFPLWLENALRQPTAEKKQPIDWKIFPSLKNRYGRTITPRMYVMTVILIESAGIHRRKNKLYNAQGFYGFMQLGASYKRYQVSDPQNNLLHGVRHLYPCLYKTLVKDTDLRHKSRPEDRLIMSSVCYNRGRYSKASKMTWPQLLRATPSTPFQKKKYFGLHDNRVAVKYGIQTKAYLGLPLSADEKTWIRNFTGVKDVDDWCNRKYSTMRNAILGRVRLSEKYGT